MLQDGKIFVGHSFLNGAGVKPEYLDLALANRHGLITGATGTGKTVTMQVLAEGFSDAGVPVFAADIKGDLSGIALPGEPKEFITNRNQQIGLTGYENRGYPTVFWDVFGKKGHPVRATVADMGPLLLSRLMDLNEVQEGVLTIMFRVAADDNIPLVDLKDLRAMLNELAETRKDVETTYGNIATASIGAIQRRLLVLEEQGADSFFGEPALNLQDFIKTTYDRRGFINIMSADELMQRPQLYATFLLWMLTTLWSELPEVGDQDKPKLVFFFDEAHLLFDDAPKALLDRVEQVARLIRSKGVGVYFITQNPLDVPDTVSSQLGNRIQHALRAFTPREQKAVRAAATTFRQNPELDTEEAILEVGVGEALVSFLEGRGEPSIVQRTLIRPPNARIGPLDEAERAEVTARSPYAGKYDQAIDRESAHEIVGKRQAERIEAEKKLQEEKSQADAGWANVVFGRGPRGGRSLGEQVTRDIGRSIMRRAIRTGLNAVFRGLGLGGRR